MIDQLLASLGFFFIIFLLLSPLALSLYGVYLAFRASPILGVISVFLHPLPLIFGLCGFFKRDITYRTAELLRIGRT